MCPGIKGQVIQFEKVSLDIAGKMSATLDGNKHNPNMQDNFSKYCITMPIPGISTRTIAHVLAKHLFSQ